MPKGKAYGNMPKPKHEGGDSSAKKIMGGKGQGTRVPFSNGPDKGAGTSSAPYHHKSRPTGNKKFPQ